MFTTHFLQYYVFSSETEIFCYDKIRFEWADIIYDMSKARHL